MDHYSILDRKPAQAAPETVLTTVGPKQSPALPAELAREPLRFPGDDAGRSLGEMAQRDLDAALQLLAERAKYITGASGAAIALRQGNKMICRASAGESAPELGAHLQVNSGLSGESVRTQRILRCDDAETDSRVNRESCRALGIASVVVMPLVSEQQVNGVFELLSGRAYAFEERDLAALERLAEMIQTALDHAEAAQRAEKEIATKSTVMLDQVAAKSEARAESWARVESEVYVKVGSDSALHPRAEETVAAKPKTEGTEEPEPPAAEAKSPATPSATVLGEQEPEAAEVNAAARLNVRGNIGKCDACGFPVSEGRKLCLDCEADQVPVAKPMENSANSQAPEFLSQLAIPAQESWLQSHLYVIATITLVAATVVLIVWRSL